MPAADVSEAGSVSRRKRSGRRATGRARGSASNETCTGRLSFTFLESVKNKGRQLNTLSDRASSGGRDAGHSPHPRPRRIRDPSSISRCMETVTESRCGVTDSLCVWPPAPLGKLAAGHPLWTEGTV